MTLLMLSALAVASPKLIHHIRLADNPWYVNDDARGQIPPFLKFRDPAAFSNDYAARYFLDSFPIGYKSLYAIAGKLKDPRWISKALPYPLLLLLTLTVGLAARRLGGWGAAWVTMVMLLTSDVFIERITGGLPRSFAFPVLALAGLALAWGRAYWLCAAALLGAALYPAAGLVAGIALTLTLLLFPKADRGDARDWPLLRRIAVVAGTAGLCALIYLPTALQTRKYGSLLSPVGEVVAAYPELGPGGRYGHRDRPPFRLTKNLRDAAMLALSGPRRVTGFFDTAGEKTFWRWRLSVSFALAGAAAIFLAWREPAGRRVLALGAAAVVGHTIARLVHPQLYLPERYTLFAIPVVVALALPAGLILLARRLMPSRERARSVVLVCVFGLILLGMGVGMRTAEGLSHVIDGNLPVVKYIKRLPPDVVIAGWPRGLMDDVPYATGRQAFLNHEIHLVFHTAYTDVMRTRAEAVISAYFATDVTPLLRLREEFGVTHLLLDRRHYKDRPPYYFAPFDRQIPQLLAHLRRDGAETMRQGDAIVFMDGEYYVLDLSRLRRATPALATP